MKNFLKIFIVLCVVTFLAIQGIRPERTNPASDPAMEITAVLSVPHDVRTILERSCYDCHSNRTVWPWYSAVSPASWLVTDDVQEGRRHLNFSEWGTYKPGKRINRLDMIVYEINREKMPLRKYLLIHRNAALSEADRDLLRTWAGAASDSLTAQNQ